MSQESKPAAKRPALRRSLFILLLLFILFLALFSGMIVGYVVLGKQSLSGAFQWSTWRHVYDLIFAS
ncbi:DNA-directed RNA polymerase subunit beta [Paenibacillus sp. SN-8-1]|uniref:DNA-directed RNA polymerase subunit beta n=1 Tax=Paenibacillus sp. SN-8-1 TaxID=3435409 RepID=UPI003D9A811E